MKCFDIDIDDEVLDEFDSDIKFTVSFLLHISILNFDGLVDGTPCQWRDQDIGA